MSNNKVILNQILTIIEELSLKDILEIVANLLVVKGADYLPLPKPDMSAEDLLKFVIDYKKTNGDSLATAMVFQGLTILLWLQK